jgi:protein-disulfide isomerase
VRAMPSGKQAKRHRRQPQAPPPPRAKGRGRRASPKVLIGVGVAAALVVLAIVLALVLTGGGSSSEATETPETGSLTNSLPGADDVQQSLSGIPQDGSVLGSPDAPVTLVEYVDLQCPFCQQFETSVMPTLITRYVHDGKLKVDTRIVAFIGPDSERGRAAALAAGDQGKLSNFVQLLYLNQGAENSGWLDEDMVRRAAASIPGLDVTRLLSDRDSGTVSDEAAKVEEQASSDGVQATPTILVGKTGEAPRAVALTSPTDEQSVTQAIDAALAQ